MASQCFDQHDNEPTFAIQLQCSANMQSPSPFGSMDVHSPCPLPSPKTHTLSAEALDQHQAAPQSQSLQLPPGHAQRDRSERASSPGGLGGSASIHQFTANKPALAGINLKSAGSLPILSSALHRRSAFAQGVGILPPSLGVTPSHEGPFPPQALILKDNSHRREAYAKGQGALPPPFSSRQMQQSSLARVNSSDSDNLHESASSAFVNMPEAPDLLTGLSDSFKGGPGRLVPSGRTMRQVESFNTDVVRQCIDKAQQSEASDKHISSAGGGFMPRSILDATSLLQTQIQSSENLLHSTAACVVVREIWYCLIRRCQSCNQHGYSFVCITCSHAR